MKVYISGPMTGIPDFNFPAFMHAESMIAARGHTAINPAKNGLTKSHSWREHMKADIRMLLDADAITLLPGWASSKGAACEYQIASALGIPIFSFDELKGAQ